MEMHVNLSMLPLVLAFILMALHSAAAEPPGIGKPPPEGVVELVGIGGIDHSLAQLKDGSLMLVGGGSFRLSTDGGLTWGSNQSLGSGVSGTGILRLQSGALALTSGAQIRVSEDEGKTWGPALRAKMLGGPFWDTMIQLKSGRLLYPSRTCYSSSPADLACAPQSIGLWRGQKYATEGHGHMPEIDIAAVSYSVNFGNTWEQSANLIGWFDEKGEPNGYGAHTSCDEPNVAETVDGRVLFLARSQVGRLVYSYSSDGGATWTAVRPTKLACSYSPPRLRRIPKTRDLLCVWNQVSGDEIRRGYRRGRLSTAISKDSGKTWEHFKTIEVSAGLDDVARVEPDAEIRWVRGRDDLGELPDNWAFFHYPNVCFAGDKVFVMYSRGSPLLGIAEKNLNKQEQVTRIYPLEWFYRD
ncbi:MAG: sialidase family protein [Planctomycetota bacterium]